MSHEQDGNHHRKLDFLYTPPDISLPSRADRLIVNMAMEKKLWINNDTMVVSRNEKKIDGESACSDVAKEVLKGKDVAVGKYKIYDKKNALPSYSATYLRNGHQVGLIGAELWEYYITDATVTSGSKAVRVANAFIDAEIDDKGIFKEWTGGVKVETYEFDDSELYEHSSKKYPKEELPLEKDPLQVLNRVKDQVSILAGPNRNVFLYKPTIKNELFLK